MRTGSYLRRAGWQHALFAMSAVLMSLPGGVHAQTKSIQSMLVGWSHGQQTPAKAEAEALSLCKGSCRVIIKVHAACAAVAVKPGGRASGAWSTTRTKAETEALAKCGGKTKKCEIRAWMCSPKDYGAIALEQLKN